MESAKVLSKLSAPWPPGPVPSVIPPVSPEAVQELRIGGRTWHVRAEGERVINALPTGAWTRAAELGWEQVKQNARRTVWRAQINGRTYYLKYYMSTGVLDALRWRLRGAPYKSEWESGLYAHRAGIVAARPIACCGELLIDGRRGAVLVTEAVEPAYALSDFWLSLRTLHGAERQAAVAQLIELLAELIARAHQSGFEHTDMHADNILVQVLAPGRYRAAFVDLHASRLGRALGDSAVVRNLAQLNQWFGRTSSLADRLRFLKSYLRWRNEFETRYAQGRSLSAGYEELIGRLAQQARRHAERLWSQRDRRLRRNGSYFCRLRVAGWKATVFLKCKHASDESAASSLTLTRDFWRAALARPLEWFAPGRGGFRKDSHSATVTRALLPLPDGVLPVFVKRPLGRNWRRRVRMLIPPSRVRRAWQIGNALLHREVPTVRPLALLERRVGPLILDSVLVTEGIPGAVDLEMYLRERRAALSSRDWLAHKRLLTTQLAQLLRRFSQRGFQHRDAKAQNFLVAPGSPPRLLLIDMDGIRHAGRRSPSADEAMLTRLHVSLLEVPGLTRTDRLRFLHSWLAAFGARGDWRSLWRAIDERAARKRGQQARRRAWKLRKYGRV